MNMNQTIETIRVFKTRNFTIRVVAEEDHDLDLSFDDTGSVREGLRSGRLCAFQVAVTVYCQGHEVGVDYLGGCIYESPKAFMDHVGIRHFSPSPGKIPEGQCGSDFSGMVRSAIAEARKNVQKLKSIRVR